MGIKDLVADLNIGYNNSMIRRNDIRQTNLNQTGVAIISLESGNKKIIPLFSLKPMEEAEKLANMIPKARRPIDVFVTNNLLDYKIEDEIREVVSNKGYLPEALVDEAALGIPFVQGICAEDTKKYYE